LTRHAAEFKRRIEPKLVFQCIVNFWAEQGCYREGTVSRKRASRCDEERHAATQF